MSRISKPSSAHAPEDLLEAGRRQPVLHYDVELGLAHLHARLEAHTPMPDWARPPATLAERILASTLIKGVMASLLATAVALVLFSMRESSRSVPSRVQSALTLASDRAPSALASEPARMDPNADKLGKRPPELSASARPTKRAAEARTQPGRVMIRPGKPAVPSSRAVPTRAASSIRDRRVDAPMPAQPPDTSADPVPARGVVEASTARVPPARVALASARIAPPSPPEPKAQPRETPSDLLEMREIAEAEQLLLSSPTRALSLVRSGDQRFADGYFQQERAYVAIMALIKLSRRQEAETAAARFYARYPPMPYGARVRRALDAARSDAHTKGE